MTALYANENFPLQVVEALRRLGHDVLTSLEAGKAGQAVSDTDVLAFAKQKNRAVLTLNRRDFIKLHKLLPDHAGIIVCTQDPDTGRQAERIHQTILSKSLAGQLLRINRPSQ
jgi:predicted nuclease of predicted toxin-antitoxin system